MTNAWGNVTCRCGKMERKNAGRGSAVENRWVCVWTRTLRSGWKDQSMGQHQTRERRPPLNQTRKQVCRGKWQAKEISGVKLTMLPRASRCSVLRRVETMALVHRITARRVTRRRSGALRGLSEDIGSIDCCCRPRRRKTRRGISGRWERGTYLQAYRSGV